MVFYDPEGLAPVQRTSTKKAKAGTAQNTQGFLDGLANTLQNYAKLPNQLTNQAPFPDPEGLAPLQRNGLGTNMQQVVEGLLNIGGGVGESLNKIRGGIQQGLQSISLDDLRQQIGNPTAPVGPVGPVGGTDPGRGQVYTTPETSSRNLAPTGSTPVGPETQRAPLPSFSIDPVNAQSISDEVARLIALEYGGQENELRRQMELLNINTERDVDVLENLMNTAPEIIQAVYRGVNDLQQGNYGEFGQVLNQARGRLDQFPGSFADYFQTDKFGAEGRGSVLSQIGNSLGQAVGNLENQGVIGSGNLLQQINDTAAEGASQTGSFLQQVAADIALTQREAAEKRFINMSDLNQLLEERGIAGTQLAVELRREAEDRNRQAALDKFNAEVTLQELGLSREKLDLDKVQQQFNNQLAGENLDLDRMQLELLQRQFGLDQTIADRNYEIDLGNLGQRQAESNAQQQQYQQESEPLKYWTNWAQQNGPAENNLGSAVNYVLGATSTDPDAVATILALLNLGFNTPSTGFSTKTGAVTNPLTGDQEGGVTVAEALRQYGFTVNPIGQNLKENTVFGPSGQSFKITRNNMSILSTALASFLNA